MKDKLTDKKLLNSLAEGKTDAWELFFARYWNKVKEFVGRVIKDGEASADVAQNVFLRIWNNRDSLVKVDSIDDYMFIAARNGALDYLRRIKTKPSVLDAETALSSLVTYMSSRHDADRIARMVEECVAGMPYQRRMVWRLSREQHLSNQEIADKVGISRRTVDRHISLALRDIRSALGGLVS